MRRTDSYVIRCLRLACAMAVVASASSQPAFAQTAGDVYQWDGNAGKFLRFLFGEGLYSTFSPATGTFAGIADGGVTTAKIKDANVTGPKIANGAINPGRLAANAVTTAKIANGAVTNSKLAAGAVDASKLAWPLIVTKPVAYPGYVFDIQNTGTGQALVARDASGNNHASLGNTDSGVSGVSHSGTGVFATSFDGVGLYARNVNRNANAVEIQGNAFIAGDLHATGTVSWSSDRRFKTNAALLGNAVGKLMSLQGWSYEYRCKEFPELNFAAGRQIGFFGQDVEKVLPELVHRDKQGYLSVNYIGLIPVLTEAMKEQQKQIDAQKAEVAALKADNAALKARMATVETGFVALQAQMAQVLANR